MPIYEYRCRNCGHEFEQWQKITDPPTDRCGKCGGPACRLISHSSFVLKGTGWYATDYGKGGGCSSAGSAPKKESVSEAPKSDTGSSDS